MTIEPAEGLEGLIINREFQLAYCPLEGRLWRLRPDGTIRRELSLWYFDEALGRHVMNNIWIPGIGGRGPNRVIWFMMVGRWPLPGMVIDHIDRDLTNSRFANFRECTPTENARNTDRSGNRCNGVSELLEAGVRKTRSGTYAVMVCQVYGGTFKSRIEANQIARQMRRTLKAEYDVPFVSWRRYHG
jgi:hypothetical protein